THSTSRTASNGGPSRAPRPTRSTSAARQVTRPHACQRVPGRSAASTFAPTAAVRGAALSRTSAARQPGSSVASSLSRGTWVAPASRARRMITLWPPAKPRFSGARRSTAPGAALCTSASLRAPVPLSSTRSHSGGGCDVATLARQRTVSAFAPQCSTETATRAWGESGVRLALVAEVARAWVLEPGGERRRDAILVRDDRRQIRPRDAERRIVPQDAALAAGSVLGSALVEHDGLVLQRERRVREARRHPDDAVVAPRELDGDVVAEAGRAVPDVDDDVENSAAQAAHELAHRRVPLEVQTAHHAAMRDGLDGLLEIRRDAQRREILAHPRLHEQPPIVGEML